MLYARTEDDCLAWLSIYLMGFLDPLSNDIACDLHAPFGGFSLTPFAGHLLCALHVNLRRDKHPERN